MHITQGLSSLGHISLAALATALAAVPATAQQNGAQPVSFQLAEGEAGASAADDQASGAPVAANDADEQAAPSEMVVTGSRIVRDGSSAPVPTTVVTMEDIIQRNPVNIADYVNQLPAIGQGQSPRATTLFANANGGANQINARGLGINRTLVLLDGRRVVGSGLQPAVDVNMLPQNLVKRVDVVTGGASAAYGSDAVAGVVNFILDTEFKGLKGSINYNQTDRSDGRLISGDLAYGASFGGGRGHVLVSGNFIQGERVSMLENQRDWFQPGLRLIQNPNWTATNGQPGQIVRTDAGLTSTPGGVIVGGPLAGTSFLPGGGVGQFIFGIPNLTAGSVQAGGTVEPISGRGAILPDVSN